MRDFETKKRQILDRVDIVEMVSEHVTLKRSGKRWVGLCPFHTEKTPSFTVAPDRGTFKCFGCDKGGDVFSFVQLRENVPFMEAMRILADRVGIELGQVGHNVASGPDRADLAKVNDWAARFFRSQLLNDSVGQSARQYVRGRNVSDETAERFGLGLAIDAPGRLQAAATRAGFDAALLLEADLVRQGDTGSYYDTFRNRLMFPIRDAMRRVIGFGGRTLGDDRAKYLNTRQNTLFDKGRSLYGIELARDAAAKRGRTVVVEGYLDCLAAHQAGFAETVATLGTALTEAQVGQLRRYCDEIILLFDSDEAGEAAAERGIRVAVPQCVTVRLARITNSKDPSDFLEKAGPREFSDLLNRAIDALEFKWDRVRERFRGESSNARRREAVLDFLRVVAESVETSAIDNIQRGLLVNQVAHLVRMDQGEVRHLLARMRPRRGKPGVLSTGQSAGRESAPQAQAPAPRDGDQVAWTQVLEVLLNEPGTLTGTDNLPDPTQIADDRDRRIAGIVLELQTEAGEFRLADVLARCHDPADAERVSELARRGAERGNYESMLRASLDRIRRASRDRELEHSKRRFLETSTEADPIAGGDDDRKVLADGVRRHTHFAPRRLIRQTSEPGPQGSPSGPSTTTE